VKAAEVLDDEESNDKVIRLESEHPYKSDLDIYEKVEISGASQLEIIFDPRCSTELKV
jgi:hypothetical protein